MTMDGINNIKPRLNTARLSTPSEVKKGGVSPKSHKKIYEKLDTIEKTIKKSPPNQTSSGLSVSGQNSTLQPSEPDQFEQKVDIQEIDIHIPVLEKDVDESKTLDPVTENAKPTQPAPTSTTKQKKIPSQHQEVAQTIPQLKIEDLKLSEDLKKACDKAGCTTQIQRLFTMINQKGISKSDIQDIEGKLEIVMTRIDSSKLEEANRETLIDTLKQKVTDHLHQKSTQNKTEIRQILFDQLVKQSSAQKVNQSIHLTKNIHQAMGDTTANLESAIILLTNDHNPITPSYLGQSTVNAKGLWGF